MPNGRMRTELEKARLIRQAAEGDVIAAHMLKNDLDFPEAVNSMAEAMGLAPARKVEFEGPDDQDDPFVPNDLLPAWFVPRMMSDQWYFALALSNGQTVGIECINKVRAGENGDVWIDVTLLEKDNAWSSAYPDTFFAPTTRTYASINASHIVMAYEIADT